MPKWLDSQAEMLYTDLILEEARKAPPSENQNPLKCLKMNTHNLSYSQSLVTFEHSAHCVHL